MMQNKFNSHQEKTDHAVKSDIVGFGWAALQIDILRECIVISEAIQGRYELQGSDDQTDTFVSE